MPSSKRPDRSSLRRDRDATPLTPEEIRVVFEPTSERDLRAMIAMAQTIITQRRLDWIARRRVLSAHDRADLSRELGPGRCAARLLRRGSSGPTTSLRSLRSR
jgi:hypothetical protein